MKLYVEPEGIDFNNPKDFLLSYLKKYNPTTYFDKDFKRYQCVYGKGRSFNDMFRLTKTYFPELKLDEFAYYVIQLRKEYSYRKRNSFASFHVNLIGCPDIQKVVFSAYTVNLGVSYTLSLTRRSELNRPYEQGGKLNFDGIKKLAKQYAKTLL